MLAILFLHLHYGFFLSFFLFFFFFNSICRIGEGNGNPLQYSCLENPREGGACWAASLWGRTESGTTEAT